MTPIRRWSTPRRRHALLQFALVAGAAALLWWTLRAMGAAGAWGEAWGLLRRLSWGAVAALVALNALVLWTLMLRWWLFLRAQGVRISQLRLLGYRLAGFAISYFTPGPQIGGEPLQIYLLARRRAAHPPVPAATATASITLDKLLEFSTNFALLLMGALFLLQRQAGGGLGRPASAAGGALVQVGAVRAALCGAADHLVAAEPGAARHLHPAGSARRPAAHALAGGAPALVAQRRRAGGAAGPGRGARAAAGGGGRRDGVAGGLGAHDRRILALDPGAGL